MDDCGATIIEVTSIQKGPQGQGLERQLERKLAILRAVLGFAVGGGQRPRRGGAP